MNLVCDEGVERAIVERLRDDGHMVRQGRANFGIVLLRLNGLPVTRKAAISADVIEKHSTEVIGAFVVISPGQVRIRPRP